MPTYTRRRWAAMLLLAGALTLSHSRLSAQSAAAPQAERPVAAQSADGRAISPKEDAKAEQEDEEYAFKHSASVRAVGRWFHLSPQAASVVFWALNAALLVLFVGYLLVTGLPKAFRSRREQLEREMVHARTSTEQANERLRVVEERLGRLDMEIAAVRAQAEQDSARDEVRLRESLEEERKKIVADSEAEIVSAGKAAERRLRHFAAELAVSRAAGRLRLSEDQDRALIQEFARELGRNGSNTANGNREGRN